MVTASHRSVYVNGTIVRPKQSSLIGEGGEAEVYLLNPDTVLKLFKLPDHPSFAGTTTNACMLQHAAKARLDIIQTKLPGFPRLPASAIAPSELAYGGTAQSNRIVGYTAPLVQNSVALKSFSQRDFRTKCGISDSEVVRLFRKLHVALSDLHHVGVVVGDFNSMNVLVDSSNLKPYFIDCDSMQFGAFSCYTYTPRYADPLNCELRNGNIELVSKHSTASDWYAFALLFWECLLFVHPYGGVYKQKAGAPRVAPDARALQRISLFHPDVQFPVAAQPMQNLPIAVLDFYQQMLEKDLREIFPDHLFDLLEGVKIAPAKVSATLVDNAQVGSSLNPRCRVLFQTSGVLIDVTAKDGDLQFLYHENGAFKREGSNTIMNGQRSPDLKFVIAGKDRTLVYKNQAAFILSAQAQPRAFPIESYRGGDPILAPSPNRLYFVRGGELWCEHSNGTITHIDSVVSNQTRIWSHEDFGLGHFSAAGLRRVFVFSDRGGKINVDLPDATGLVAHVHCLMGSRTAWLFQTIKRAGLTVQQCSIINRKGAVLNHIEIADDDDNAEWFAADHSKCVGSLPDATGAIHDVLFLATIDGVAQIQIKNGRLEKTRVYEDVKEYARPGDRLLFTDNGLIAWDSQEIRLVTSN